MKILQVSTPVLPISPDMKYGGTERVVRDLDEAYVEMGHDSIVFAPEDSEVYGRLIPSIERSTWRREEDGSLYKTLGEKESKRRFEEHCEKCLEVIARENPDAVHDHTKLITSDAYANGKPETPILTTFHGDFDERSAEAIRTIEKIRRKGINYFGAISESQRRIFEGALNFDFMVYNGLNTGRYPFNPGNKGYLFSIGKFDRNKGQDTAIRAAKDLGENLILAGPVHSFRPHLQLYWEEEILPNLDESFPAGVPCNEISSLIERISKEKGKVVYIGEVDDRQKKKWFGNAKGFLMPIRWNEPFGLVMIESMACGTPVVAYDLGAVSEILDDEVTGFILNPGDYEGFLSGIERLGEINPDDCRRAVESRFDTRIQAENYINVFEKMNEKSSQ